ncbi:OmpA family protein [Marinigracilibium pacificum]|uniref:OmpA family protein n=1 Tax=Marinigracilibium pacificum TaxID=2729599 RepID=A0A848IYM9_9BACT|nr:OmpA family protein [Marinigracilibium pacificum]NMM48385.1 OmpA family protein [Marinigracilibium pacificum]
MRHITRKITLLAIILCHSIVINAESDTTSNKRHVKEKLFQIYVEDVGLGINTKYHEIKPIISPDGQSLFFSRMYYPGNIGGASDEQDIYFSKLVDNKWTFPVNMKAPINNSKPNGMISISPDGKHILLLNSYKGTNAPVSQSFIKEDGSWSEPEDIKIYSYYNKSIFADFHMAPNNRTLLMAIERNDSRGDQDLYVSFILDNGQWSPPLHMGDILNSKGAEFSPYLSADGRTLYFSSTGHDGYGESDIFYSKRLDDTWTKWSAPINMGPQVNSPGWEAYYSVPSKSDYAYFISGEEGNSKTRNIYKIPADYIDYSPDETIMIEGNVEAEEENLVVKVKNSLTGEDLAQAFTSGENGEYKLLIPKVEKIDISASGKNSFGFNKTIDLSEVKLTTSIDLKVEKIEKGSSLAMTNLLFKRTTPILLKESYPDLNNLAALMRNNSKIKILIEGHTDNVGPHDSKMELSNLRAQTIKNQLINLGIEENRIKTEGFGDTRPVAPNTTEENKQRNRRVEIKILSF